MKNIKLLILFLLISVYGYSQSSVISGGSVQQINNNEVTTSALNPVPVVDNPLAGQPFIWQNTATGNVFKWNGAAWVGIGEPSGTTLTVIDNTTSPDAFDWTATESTTDDYQINYNGNTWLSIDGATGKVTIPGILDPPAFIATPQTTVQRDALTGAAVAGGLLYNSTVGNFQYHNGTLWQDIGGGANITTGTLATATAARTADFGGFGLLFDNVNIFRVEANAYRLGDGAGASLPTLDSDVTGSNLTINTADNTITRQNVLATQVLTGAANPVNGTDTGWYNGQLYVNTTSNKLFRVTAKSTDPDAAATGSTFTEIPTGKDWIVESVTLTITGTGATATLANTPDADAEVLVYVDGQMVDALAGSGMVVVGTAVTFNNAILGQVLDGSERITATYFKQ
jgi:hypothetical protein